MNKPHLNKSLFYGIATFLILVCWWCVFAVVTPAQPTNFIGVLVVCLIIDNLIFVIEEGLGLGSFVASLFFAVLASLGMGLLNAVTNASGPNLSLDQIISAATTWTTTGLKWVSLIWPLAVLCIGSNNYDNKSQKEDAKSEETKKDEAEKEH